MLIVMLRGRIVICKQWPTRAFFPTEALTEGGVGRMKDLLSIDGATKVI
jgi:hypothetical protein